MNERLVEEMLSDQELFRYSRQLLLENLDISGQEQLKKSRVLIAGLGGLGSIVAMYLAGAGVGCLVIVDGDEVDITNLHRQVLYKEADVGLDKSKAAQKNLLELNSEVDILTFDRALDSENILSVLKEVDIVVDSTDNYTARYNLNRACLSLGIPMVSASAQRFEGQITIINPALGGPCYRCLYTDDSQHEALSCSEGGILSPILGVLGSLQAFEVVRFLCNFEKALVDSILFIDLLTLDFRQVKYSAKKDCPDCSRLRG